MIKVSIAHYNLLPLLFLSQLVLYSAQESRQLKPRGCSHFDCGRLGEIGYPFFTVGNPECGVIALNCTGPEPRVQFHEKGKWYLVNDINYLVRHIEIFQRDVQNHLASNRCDLLETFTEQAYLKGFNQHVNPFLSFNITETHPFFKCKHKPSFVPSFTPPFFNQFDKHSCSDYDLYFKNQEKSLPSLPESLSDYCSVVHLTYPRVPEYESGGVTANLISQWGARFKIDWKVLQACLDCFEIGGECMNTPNRSFKCDKKGANVRRKIEIAALSVGGVGIMGVMFSLLYYTKWRSRKPVLSTETATRIDFEEFIKQQVPFAPKRYSFKEIKRITSSFKDELGRGGYGSVFKGTLHDGKFVAVKVLSETKGNGEEFINEVASISRTSHVNIVSLLGYCFDGSKRALIYEFMPNGSLEKYIYDEQSSLEYSSLGWETLYQIAVGIARGLEYLHRGCNTRILHFDIKPHNILLDQDFCPKISDFGLAKLCPRKESIISLLGARGIAGYIAPEVFSRNFGGISHKSDVYSYGMMILEMVGGRKNIDIGVDHTSKIYFPSWIYKRIELHEDIGLYGIISETQGEITRKMILVGLWCIQTNPLDRPAISRVLDMLEGSLEVLEIPPKPYFSSPSRIQEGSSDN